MQKLLTASTVFLESTTCRILCLLWLCHRCCYAMTHPAVLIKAYRFVVPLTWPAQTLGETMFTSVDARP